MKTKLLTTFIILTISYFYSFSQTYCTPSGGGGSCTYEMITGFTLNGEDGTSINNVSGCSNGAYGDFTEQEIDLKVGETYSGTVSHSGYNTPMYRIWIDYNQNGTFDNEEEIAAFNGSQNNTSNFSFTVPNDNSLAGTTRLRIRLAVNFGYSELSSPGQINPCTTNNGAYGNTETEDYTVNILPSCELPTISTQPISIGFCNNSSQVFSVEAESADDYQWQVLEGGNWNDIDDNDGVSDSQSETITFDEPDITWNGKTIRCKVSNNTCGEVFSNEITLEIYDSNFTFDQTQLDELFAPCEMDELEAPSMSNECGDIIFATTDVELPITQSTEVVWSYDIEGEIMTQTQDVTITYTIEPNEAELEDIVEICSVIIDDFPTASDGCGGVLYGVSDVEMPIYASTEITWTYTTSSGDQYTQTQNVIIEPIDNTVSILDDYVLSANASGYNYQWIECSSTFPIEGATFQTYAPTENGLYAVMISDGECEVISDCIEITELGLSTESEVSISIFPNPATNLLNIEMNHPKTLHIYNVLGKKIEKIEMKDNNYQLDVNDYKKGVYLIKIDDSFVKFIKE